MGKFLDSLFNRDKYNAIKNIYNDLMAKYPQGLNIFLLQKGYRNHYPNDYSFNELIYTNSHVIKQLQEDFDAEERRRQAIKSKVYTLSSNYPCGFGYYTYKHPNSNDEQICDASNEIKGYDKIILSVKKLKENNPDGFQYCTKTQGLLLSSLDPPYSSDSEKLIYAMKDRANEVKSCQKVFDLRNNYLNGFRLVISPDHNEDLAYIEQRAEEIKNADKDFRELCELRNNNRETFNYLISNLSKDPNIKFGQFDLDFIHQVLEYKQFLSEIDFQKTNYYKPLSNSQRKYILALPSPEIQKMYILKSIFSAKDTALKSSEPDDCNTVVGDFLKNCYGINIKGVSYNTYFKTVSRLAKDDHSIDSALALINKHRQVVKLFYNIENEDLPFSALLDIYYDNRLSQSIKNAETFREDAKKADSIMMRYPLGYKSLLAQGRIKDILKTRRASHDELKWIIANENVFRTEQAAKEQEEKINRAKRIISSNLEAVSRLMPGVSSYSLTSSRADRIIREESNLSTLTGLLEDVTSWGKTRGIPHYFFYWYYSKHKYPWVTHESEYARKLIWNFKNGESQEDVIDIVKRKLRSTFGSDCSRLTLVCIPASTINSNQLRYKYFANDVCSNLGMTDAFNKIIITKEKSPSHQGGTDSAVYSLETTFFFGKYIVLFDDVVTTGHSIALFKNKLESFGAIVICAISIGRTYSDYYGDDKKPHPWSDIL